MKSCLGMLFTILVLTAVIGGSALLWYLSHTAEITPGGRPSADQQVR